MKQIVMLELLKKLRSKPHLKRKLKIFLVVGFVGFLITSALVVWAGVAVFNFASNKASQIIESPQASAKVEALKTQATQFSALQAAGCWAKAQSLMAVEPWLLRPALENLGNLKVACFGQSTPVTESAPICKGDECTEKKNLMRTAAEGEMI